MTVPVYDTPDYLAAHERIGKMIEADLDKAIDLIMKQEALIKNLRQQIELLRSGVVQEIYVHNYPTGPMGGGA